MNILCTYVGSYMSALVLLNLLQKLGNRDKMRGLPSILSLFCNEFNKFNNTRAQMLEWHYLISAEFCKYVRNIVMDIITLPENL